MISSKTRHVKVRLQQFISPTVVTLGRGFAAVTAGSLLGRLLNAIAGLLLVRYFNGPALYGQYAILVTTLALISTVLGLGLDTWLLREGGRDPTQLAFNARRLLMFKLITASFLISVLVLAWNHTGLNWILIVGMLGVIAESYIRTGHVILHALNRNTLVAILQSVDSFFAVVLILILMIWPPQIAFVVVGQSVVSGITLAIVAILLAEYWRGTWRPLHLPRLIRNTSFFVLADVLANIYSQAQIAILALFTNDLIVGTFRSANNLITISFLVPMAMFNVGLPVLSRPNLERRHRHYLLAGMVSVSVLYGIVVLGVFWQFGSHILRIVYGNNYEATIRLLTPLSVIPLFKSLSFVAVAIMLSLGKQRLRVFIQSIVVMLSLLGGFIFIPRLGLDGATLTYILVEGLLCILYWTGAIYTLRKTNSL
ncbi:oligosaccharide flippase family protein [uncultured Chloroflexus sp.]|uniref:lipopolysaccharide biosynthesis protein n=1 Tax=uncultured Chloroflexus sp. TaxID=214040 RepID=UPI002619080D|nr:oligosaccharide flippase family protein [uncultured Chloroflexus sp.]